MMNNKINNSRKNFEKLGTIYNGAENIVITKETFEHVTCYWFNKKEIARTNKLIIYLHGGCFVLGSIKSHQSLVSHLSEHLELPILFIEYSLAPEKPFPSAINEIGSVYNHILLQYPESDIIFMGDSAGAGLAVSVLSKLNIEGIKYPSHLVMFSPWIDLTCSNESLTKNADNDPILTKKALLNYASLYASNDYLSDANPIEAKFEKYPPTLILVGSGEILLDDSKSIYNKIACVQEKVKFSIYDNLNHVWMLENIHTKESEKTLSEIKDFIRD